MNAAPQGPALPDDGADRQGRRDHRGTAERRRHRHARRSPSLAPLVEALNDGAAAVLVAEEHLAGALKAPLAAWLSQQPPWSDLPILILTRPGADSPESAEAWRTLGNVTLLERPTRVTTLLSAAQTAIRARARQYQIRGHLAERLKNEQALRIRRSPQGRVPRHARPRAAQSARADPQQPRDPEALGRVRRRRGRAGRAR